MASVAELPDMPQPVIPFRRKPLEIRQLEASYKIAREAETMLRDVWCQFSDEPYDPTDGERIWFQTLVSRIAEHLPSPLAPSSVPEAVLNDALSQRIDGMVDLCFDAGYTAHDVKVILRSVLKQTIDEAVAMNGAIQRDPR